MALKIGKFGFSLFSQTFIKILATALGLYTTRWLISHTTGTDYNAYLVIIDFSQIILTVIELGIPRLVQKYYTNNQNEADIPAFWTTFTYLRLLSYFVGVVLIGLTYQFSSVNNLGLILGIFSLQFILLTDIAFRSICDAKGHTWQFSLTDLANRLLLVFGLIAFDVLRLNYNGLQYFLLITLVSYLVGIIADAIWQKPYYSFGEFDFDILKKYLQPILYLGISGFTVAMYMQTRKIILNNYGFDQNLVNGFGNAEKIFTLVGIVPGLTMPMIASMVKKRLDAGKMAQFGNWLNTNLKFSKTKSIMVEWFSYTFGLSVVLTLGMLVFGPLIIWLVDSQNKYGSALQVLPIFSLGMIPFTPVVFFAHLIVFLNGEKYELYTTTILAIIGLILYFLWIPSFGIFGAAWATVTIFFIDLIVKIFFLQRILDEKTGFYKE
jgi:O-antigen/teichoic acid export membrane protein